MSINLKRICLAVFYMLLIFITNAQPGCPAVNAGNNVNLSCGTSCTTLTAVPFQVGSTSTYTVSQIPYAPPVPFNTGTVLANPGDDYWSPVIYLPFNFCYFGSTYNAVIVESNGAVSFDTTHAYQNIFSTASYTIDPGTPAPWAGEYDDLDNSILTPYQDLDNTYQGNIYYEIGGVAPCRYFKASWYNMAMFGDSESTATGNCLEDDHQTQMVIFYETTNAIEIYIQQKDVPCDDGGAGYWNGGLAIEGIQNAALTTFIGVPGRNATQWSATNDAWRFTPAGPSIVNVSWYNGATQISTDSVVQVCPSAATTTYTAKAVYTPCSGPQVTVTDNVTVTLAGALSAGIDSFRNISCSGPNGGAIYAHATSANPPVTYGWSNGSTALTLTNLAPGTYIFTASDASGCTRSDTVTLTQPVPITANVPAAVTLASCSGTNPGSLTVQTTGGNSPFSYSWNNGEQGVSDTLINPGTYTVTVTDANLCSVTASGTLTSGGGGGLTMGAPTITNVDCFGNNTGSIVTDVTGGVPPYSYRWSDSETGAGIQNLLNNSYSVTATDVNGCIGTATYTVAQPPVLSINAPVLQNIGCSTTITGAITAEVSGGTPAYTYSWTEVSTGQTLTGVSISNLQPDTYTLTVTDANSCTTAASYQITKFTPLVISVDSTNVSCYGGSNGTAAVTVVSGTAPYVYSWDQSAGGANTTIANLSQGPVDIFVTDANNCTADRLIYITQPPVLTVPLTNTKNVSCFGGNDGALTVSANGGTPTYLYSWNNGPTGVTDAALALGTYIVTVTDANGCTASASYSVTQPNQLQIDPAVIQNIGCAGGNSGSITANASQGTPAYTYKWTQLSNGQTYNGQTISNLAVDNYSLTVTDANGCTVDTSSYAITAIPLLSFTTSSIPVSCYNGNNGAVLASVTSGTPPYQYSFNNGPDGPDSATANLSAGLLLINVTDANNCNADTTINISQPTQLVVSLVNAPTNIICNGGNNGEIDVTATGATPGYTYNWSNQFTGTNNTGLTAGTYTLTVIDNNACADTEQYIITQPTAVAANPIVTNALCWGTATGKVDANPSGGVPGYSFIWNNGQTTQIADTLAQGLYDFTVTDANGCSVVATATMGQPTRIVLTQDSAIAVLCVGQKNGQLIVTASGGFPPYYCSATQDEVNFVTTTNGIIEGLDTGVYTIQIFDSVGCSVEYQKYVPNAIPDVFYTPRVDSTLCYGPQYNDGGVFVLDSTIANEPYQYSIDGGVLQDTGYFANLSAGPHTVTAVSHNGCKTTIPVVVPEPLPIEAIVYPDTVTLPLGGSQSVLVTTLNTTNPAYNWSPAIGLSCADCPNPVVNAYTPGNYVVTVSMINGTATCYGMANLTVNVLSHTKAFTPNAFSPNGDGNNDLFQVFGEDIKTIDMKVFNRWGEEVYSTTNSMAGWDGSYKGQLQMPGVYTYIVAITYLDNSQETRKGTVTLLR